MQDAQIASEQIERDAIVRLYLAKKLQDLLAGVCLILKARVQAVKEDNGGAGGRIRSLNAVGKNIGRQRGPSLARESTAKTATFCSLPLSRMVKSSFLRSAIGSPFLSCTTTFI
jgi:hypothetical protein